MTILRRFLVIQALMLWQGGFLFYAAFVVPAGAQMFGTEAQGTVTARVTESLNLCGVAALAILLWELLATWNGPRRRLRVACWTILLVGQGLLFYLHRDLTGMMDADRTFVVKRTSFYSIHQVYLIASTVQWAIGLVFTWLMLRTWYQKMN